MPLQILNNHSLKHHNSFGFNYYAEYFCLVNDAMELAELIMFVEDKQCSLTVIGSGSNVVLEGDVQGVVAINRIKGMSTSYIEGSTDCILELASGEIWHEAVEYSVRQGLYGIENLALIPGTAGAAPIQNIGAYGVEIKDILQEVEVYNRLTGALEWIGVADCHFSYRESRFKHEWKGSHIVTKIRLKLSTLANTQLDYFAKGTFNTFIPSALEIFNKVSAIRQKKLPDPKKLGNAGSFFKNPIVSDAKYLSLKHLYPDLVSYQQGDGWKLAAGWLIDRAGWKGHRVGGVGVYEAQALVLVNYDNETSDNLLKLQTAIVDDVKSKFGVQLEREPTALG
ncbi:UDP-N-acetylmuramate dehydrogenase [Marinomonas algicola]|uniref:UDP-N-acetylmuramate dehydrogenase n=1 Tax=Marinomonas algicola TaxID=2773454 RepID=UPI00174D5BE1|nr:UDP-N-acetylmuramate dehydrogenase [Marinomonas algicola]